MISRAKRFGQHFLRDARAIALIVRAIAPEPGETIIEVGPGTGALTVPLAAACRARGARLIAIEKDPLLIARLESEEDTALTDVRFRKGDALTLLPELVRANRNGYAILGNIPYYLTGALIRLTGELSPRPRRAIFTLQQEVAERITALPPRMNLLAAAVQFWAHPRILATLPPQAFDPPPTISSAVLELSPHPSPPSIPEGAYYRFMKIAFRQPRKTLVNNLSWGFKRPKPDLVSLLRTFALTGQERPQELSVPLLIKLASRMRSV